MFRLPTIALRRLALLALLLASLVACGGTAAQPTTQSNLPPTEAPAAPTPTTPAQSGEEPSAEQLPGTKWVLVEYGPADSPTPTLPNAQPTLSFEPGAVSGSGGCNSFGGSYSVDGGEIRFADIAMTMMGCDGPISTQEGAYMQLLNAARQWRIAGDELIVDAEGGRMRFTREAAAAETPLVGTTWRLDGFEEGDTVKSLIMGSEITLVLTADGQASGSGGCNSYGATHQIDSDKITFRDIAATEMACEDQGVTEQEGEYLMLLQQVRSFTLEGQRLRLVYEGGALTFKMA